MIPPDELQAITDTILIETQIESRLATSVADLHTRIAAMLGRTLAYIERRYGAEVAGRARPHFEALLEQILQ